MGTTTSKLKLTKPYESDYFDIGVFNDNADKIDALTHIVASGSTTSTKYAINSTSTSDGTFTWYYKKYDDKTFEAMGNFTTTNLRCNESWGEDGAYISGYIRIKLPSLGIKSIYMKSLNIAANGASETGYCRFNWTVDTTEIGSVLQHVDVRLAGFSNEPVSEAINKTIYISIQGTWG